MRINNQPAVMSTSFGSKLEPTNELRKILKSTYDMKLHGQESVQYSQLDSKRLTIKALETIMNDGKNDRIAIRRTGDEKLGVKFIGEIFERRALAEWLPNTTDRGYGYAGRNILNGVANVQSDGRFYTTPQKLDIEEQLVQDAKMRIIDYAVAKDKSLNDIAEFSKKQEQATLKQTVKEMNNRILDIAEKIFGKDCFKD